MFEIFDIEKKCKELKIPNEVFNRLLKEIKDEFPNDTMMFELHLLRALMAHSQIKKRS